MPENLRTRMRARYEYVRERDRRWLQAIPVERMERYLRPLLGPFIVLNSIDVLTTLVAMRSPAFRELNPVAATLFGLSLNGFAIAVILKCVPVLALVSIAYVKDRSNRHPIGIRIVKLSAIAVLVAGDLFYVVVVGSNLGNLLRLYY